jgi:hypothetical protein
MMTAASAADLWRPHRPNYWRRGENGAFWLDKENEAFDSERLDAHGGWTLWRIVTRIVDTPVRPRRPRRG